MRPTVILFLVMFAPAVLSGCLQADDDGDDTPATGDWTHGSEYGVDLFAVTLHERITPGAAKTWAFEARNLAPSDNDVEYNAACGGPFQVTVIGIQGRELQSEEPGVECAAMQVETLEAGEELAFSWDWDGRIWTEDEGAITPMRGVYTIRVTFEGFHAGNPDHRTDGVQGQTTVFVEGR